MSGGFYSFILLFRYQTIEQSQIKSCDGFIDRPDCYSQKSSEFYIRMISRAFGNIQDDRI